MNGRTIGATTAAALVLTLLPAVLGSPPAARAQESAGAGFLASSWAAGSTGPISATVNLRPVAGSAVTGAAIFTYLARQDRTTVTLTAVHVPAPTIHRAAIRDGACGSKGRVLYTFPPLHVGRDQSGASSLSFTGSFKGKRLSAAIYGGPGGTSEGTKVAACGDLTPSGAVGGPTAAPRPTGTPGQAGGKGRPAATSTPSPAPTPSGPTPTPAPTVGQPSRVAISTTVTLRAAGGSKVSGLAVFLYVGYSHKTSVIVTALHLPALSSHAAALRQGTCASPGAVVVPFPAIKGGKDGRGVTNAFVRGNATKRHLAVFVYAGPTGVSSRVLACGALR